MTPTAWHPDVSALILAGGKATRFGGAAKHQLLVDGRPIIERQLAVLRPRVMEVLLSLPHATPPPAGAYRVVVDRVADVGPLAGIHAGLSACRTNWLLVVAGDMPDLSGALLDRMLELVEDALARETALDAVGVRANGLVEPLVCALHRRLLPNVDARITAGRWKASALVTDESLEVAWVDAEPAEVRNVNAPEDL